MKSSGWATSLIIFAIVLSACAPKTHTIKPYADDTEAARKLEARAKAICCQMRGCSNLPTRPFTTDGCSRYPDGSWVECCIEHDIRYWCGGSAEMRKQADLELKRCVSGKGFKTRSSIMYRGTRVGGSPWLPFPWRWGYGWDWPHDYDRVEGQE
jgi:hypothetical protein